MIFQTAFVRRFALLFVGSLAALCTTGDRFAVESQIQGSSPAAQASQIASDGVAIDEAPESDDPNQRAERAAKNARYYSLGNDQDLTTLPPGMSIDTISCGTYDPTILPTGSHEVIVLGTLLHSQPYLSANRTAIYTEYQLKIDEVFKPLSEELSLVEDSLVIDRPGGVLRMNNGRVITSTESATRMARPLDNGRRYILFCRRIHENRDLILGYAFELRAGKVYALGESAGNDLSVAELPGAVADLAEEQVFLKAIREAVEHPNSARYFSAPRN